MCFITILAAFSTCRCANRSTGGNQSVSSWRTTNGRNNMLNTYYSKHAVKTFHIKFHCINIHCVKQGYEEQQKLISVSWNQTSEQQKWSSDRVMVRRWALIAVSSRLQLMATDLTVFWQKVFGNVGCFIYSHGSRWSTTDPGTGRQCRNLLWSL